MSSLRATPLPYALSIAAALAVLACSPDAGRDPLSPSARKISAARSTVPFHGTVEAFETSVYQPETHTVLIHVEGTGTATHLGRYTLVSDFALDPETLTGTQRATLTAANGDVLTATVAAQGIPNDDGVTLNTVESATITGGTGRFAGASGSYILRRVLVEATGVSSGAFEGTIDLGK
jgi:hypothetical protein